MELLVYKASAGSGKTFTLAAEYIKHLIINPRAYRQILAVTFTNKATAEMKDRILQQLDGLWKGRPSSDAYLHAIREKLQDTDYAHLSDDNIRRRAGQALQYMLHDYSRFRVETIDSFFQSVMRNLARELELTPNLNIELDTARVLDDAVDSLIEKLTPDSPVLAWLLDYIEERINDDRRWNVSGEIKAFGRYIFDEEYIERGNLLRRQMALPGAVKLYRELLRATEDEALKTMQDFGHRFHQTLDDHLFTEDDLSNKSKGIASYFNKLIRGSLRDKNVANATLAKHLDSPDNWVSKTHPRRADLMHLVETELYPLLEEAERLRPLKNSEVTSCHLSLQHLNKLQLLNHIDEEVRAQNAEQNRFLLSDTTALLHNLVHEGDSSFVFEKIGAQIRNVMIDEFQDTSRMQWDNFRLLLLEGLSQGEDSLIVGDVKQSIYRWRNGDWRILNGLQEDSGTGHEVSSFFTLHPSFLKVKTLTTNRRSEANVIHFNNHFFTAAVEYLNAIHLNELHEECLQLKQAYADVVQQSPKKEQRGNVRCTLLQPDEELTYQEQTLEALGQEVQRLLADGVPMSDITILVRKNKNIPPIADYFDRELHLTIVSDEAFRLDASPAVCALIDALRCIDNPEDKISQKAIQLNEELKMKNEELNTAQPHSSFLTLHSSLDLKGLPLPVLLETLYRELHLERIPKQDAYLFAFFDAVTLYLKSNAPDITVFLRHWDEVLCSKTIPGGNVEGIRILSIHKSKGLEFHTVLVPFCDWRLENETNNQLLWCAPAIEPYNHLNLVPVTYSQAMAESVYRADYLTERLQLWVDNLNLLYVALTRAEHNLVLWARQGQKGTMSELLENILPGIAAQGLGRWDEEEYTYFLNEEVRMKNEELNSAQSTAQPHSSFFTLHSSFNSRFPSVEFRQSNRSADFIAGVEGADSPRHFIDRGRLLHTLFSAIRTTADIDTAVDRLLFDGILTRDEEADIRHYTHRAFSQPDIRRWYTDDWMLLAERDIIWRSAADGTVENRRPDRVITRPDGSETVVIDFKFGKSKAAAYRRQVQGYLQLLRRMGTPAHTLHGYLWYVDEARVEEVTEK